jgi:ribosomal protein L16/L10AE
MQRLRWSPTKYNIVQLLCGRCKGAVRNQSNDTDSSLTFSMGAGMRGAYGKPNGLCARVKINQIMFSIRTTQKGEEAAVEALRKVSLQF